MEPKQMELQKKMLKNEERKDQMKVVLNCY